MSGTLDGLMRTVVPLVIMYAMFRYIKGGSTGPVKLIYF